MKKTLALLLLAVVVCSFCVPKKATPPAPAAKQYIELRIYHFTTAQQMAGLDSFFRGALLPALHQSGIDKAGVFMATANDTATDKKAYVLIPYKNLKQFEQTPAKLLKNTAYTGSSYFNAAFNRPLYNRFETILLTAFSDAPQVIAPALTGDKANRVYELRSYEGSTEKLFANKVEMFNKGGEVGLFSRLGFNAVFYGEVVSGGKMPNLMYMTSFNNKATRDSLWKQFGADPFWKVLSAKPEYKNNVSHIDITFLTPTPYSDL